MGGGGVRHLTIYRYYFTASDCYNESEPQEQKGVQVHCTVKGASYLRRWVGPDDGRLGKNRYSNYHNRPGGDVCANAYIGKLADKTVACYQALPWDYRCWLSANGDNGNANRMGYIGFEIACDNMDDEAYFREAVMGVSVNLTAYLCAQLGPFGTDPWAVLKEYKQGKALAVMDHHELAKLELGSNHADISHWLKKYGLTMDDYRNAVVEAIREGVKVTYIDAKPLVRPTLRKGSEGEDVRALQDMLNAFGPYGGLEVDGVYGRETEASVRALQGDTGLTPDGITGPKTWAKLEEMLKTMPESPGGVYPVAPEEPSEEPSAPPALTIEQRLARLELAVFGAGGESNG